MYEISQMNEELSLKFLSSIRPLLCQSNFFGLITFEVSSTNFRGSTIHSLFNIIAILAYIYGILHGVYYTALAYQLIIYRTTDIIILVINAIYVTTTWIFALTKRHSFIDFLLKLIDFDIKLSTLGVKINYGKCRKRILIQILARHVILIANIVSLAWLSVDRGADMTVESMAYLLLTINSAICHLTIECVLILKSRFVILNRQIIVLIDHFAKNNVNTVKSSKRELHTLNKICALHHHLSKLIKQFNDIFGVTLLLMFGVSFVIIVISTFYFVVALNAPEMDVIGGLICFLSNATFIINVIYICDVCYSTIEEVNRTGELIHKIDTEDHDIRDEIEMFSLQIANEQVEFNAAGFFPINYTLIFSITGGVTTYIIILIQLAASLAENY